MKDRKKAEIEYYDKRVKNSGRDFERFKPQDLVGFKFLYDLLKKYVLGKQVLDYGCGNGIHTLAIAKMGAKKVVGIDLSERSLEIVKEKVKRGRLEDKIEFLKMDCEKMDFPNNYFDIIFDGGTFSSIDLNIAYPELARVLKPAGLLIGVETFGHNPITNLKRKLNKLTGKRTSWAAEHIFKTRDLEEAKKHFSKIEVFYFHLISWLAFPFLRFKGANLLLKILEGLDKILLKASFLRKYAFKVVFTFSQPK